MSANAELASQSIDDKLQSLTKNPDMELSISKIKEKDDFSDIIIPHEISELEFAYDIWLFSLNRTGPPSLKGIYRDGVVKKLEALGYWKRYRENGSYVFIKLENNIIQEVDIVKMKDDLFSCVKGINNNIEIDFRGLRTSVRPAKLRETFERQSHLLFNRPFLEHLQNHNQSIIRDTRDKSFIFFKNVVVEVTVDNISLIKYPDFKGGCIWRDHIIDHEFTYISDFKKSHFETFIFNVSNGEEDRIKAFGSGIGYLLHNYSDPSKGQAVILYDEEITDARNPQGGTGKGIFANGILQMREMITIDGKKFDPNDRFRYQSVRESTQVVRLDDIKPKLGFDTFHSCLTEGWTIERKNEQQFFISPEKSPKLILSSNSILNDGGKTNKRRQFVLEFSNHYSSRIKEGIEEPVKSEHGCIFFKKDDWDQDEWNRFYSFMLDTMKFYFIHGLLMYEHKSLEKNKLIQSTSEEFFEWVNLQEFESGKEYSTSTFFQEFRDTYFGEDSDFKQRGFTLWLKKYAASKNWEMTIRRNNGGAKFWFKSLSL